MRSFEWPCARKRQSSLKVAGAALVAFAWGTLLITEPQPASAHCHPPCPMYIGFMPNWSSYTDDVISLNAQKAVCNWNEIDILPAADGDAAKQIQAITDYMSKVPSGTIVIDPADVSSLAPVLKQIRETTKYPVILLHVPQENIELDKSLYSAAIATDYTEEGRKAAQALRGLVADGKGDVGVIKGPARFPPTQARLEGFAQELGTTPDLKLASVAEAEFSPETIVTATQGLLISNPDLKGILVQYDAMVPAVRLALENAGKTEIKTVSIGASRKALQQVVDGQLSATVGAVDIGGAVCETIARAVENFQPAFQVMMPVEIFDPAKAAIVLEAR